MTTGIHDGAAAEPTRMQRLLDVPLGSPTRPSWRGRLHLLALLIAIPVFTVLAIDVRDDRTRIGVLIYALGLCSMFAVSTTYHRWVHTVRARALWRRADHATIFVGIAATCTPLCLALEPRSDAGWRLAVVWGIAAVGVIAKATGGRRGHRLGDVLYMANSWAGVLILPAIWRAGHMAAAILLAAGGVVYTVGAVGFARQWPRLNPSSFGFHEVWHTATIVAAGTHVAAVWMVTA